MTATRPRTAFEQFLDRYGPPNPDGPRLFVMEVLGADPDPWQVRMLDAYGRRARRLSIRSCHGPGKTALAAWLIAYTLFCLFPQKTALTAPTKSQLFDALFTEVVKWIKRCPVGLQQLVEIKSDRIEMLTAKEESFITARTSRAEKPEALQGIHCDPGYVLLVVDEASGVPEAIFEAAGGSMSGHNCTTLLLSNPVRTTGMFYDTHTLLADQWETEHVSHEDSPRVSDDYVTQLARQYGEDSNVYRVRALGEFPRGDDDTFIPLWLVDGAVGRDVDPVEDADIIWGLDCARFGNDRTALCKRKGNAVDEDVQTRRQFDTMQVAGWVARQYDDVTPDNRPETIFVDVIGIGAGVVDRLREQNYPVIGINVSEAANSDDKYADLRTELWGRAGEWLRGLDVLLPAGGSLRHELSAPIKDYTSSGKLRLESKRDTKKRLRRMGSPDEADAFVLTFAGGTDVGRHGKRKRREPMRRNNTMVA